jgi:hypothetical protein
MTALMEEVFSLMNASISSAKFESYLPSGFWHTKRGLRKPLLRDKTWLRMVNEVRTLLMA